MKTIGTAFLSLMLVMANLCLALPAGTSDAGFPVTSPNSSPADACCQPAARACCHARCCVEAPPARPAPPLTGAALPSGTAPSPVSSAALLHALWQLPAPPARDLPSPVPGTTGNFGPGLPLFLRYAALLI